MKASSGMMNLYDEEKMRWSYKTVYFGLKKEGLLGSAFLDEAEIEVSLNEFGKAGWELVSFMEVNQGLIAVFKQPFSKALAHTVQEDEPMATESTASAGGGESSSEADISHGEEQMVSHERTESEGVGAIKIL